MNRTLFPQSFCQDATGSVIMKGRSRKSFPLILGEVMVTCLLRVAVLSLFGCALLAAWPACAQDTRGTWQEAVRLLDSTSPADTVAAISKLEAIVSAEHTIAPPPAALTTLALLQLRQQDYEAAAGTLKRLSEQYTPAQLQARRGAILRMSLIVALAREDAASAEAAFKDLVRSLASEQGDPIDQKLIATSIGTTVGMLGVARAKSPITSRVLQIGSDQMLMSKLRGVGVHYQAAHENSIERTQALVAHLVRIEKDGIDAVAAELAQRQEALKQRSSELLEQKELTGEVIRNTREQVDQNTHDIRKLAGDINRINLQLRQPTPGHPGPKRPAPRPLPSRLSIPVDEFEIINDYDTVVQNGQTVRVPVTRQVRRPQSEIDYERNRIYNQMRGEYDRAVSEYRAYDADYNQRMASWIGEDQRRRQELNKDKADLEIKRNDLVAANKAINDDKKESAKDLKVKRTAAEQEEFEVELLSIAVQAYRDGKPHSAFRPQHFEPLNWTQEKVLLQKETSR